MHKDFDRSIPYRTKGRQRINQESEMRILYAEQIETGDLSLGNIRLLVRKLKDDPVFSIVEQMT